jgi:hypothetical protein
LGYGAAWVNWVYLGFAKIGAVLLNLKRGIVECRSAGFNESNEVNADMEGHYLGRNKLWNSNFVTISAAAAIVSFCAISGCNHENERIEEYCRKQSFNIEHSSFVLSKMRPLVGVIRKDDSIHVMRYRVNVGELSDCILPHGAVGNGVCFLDSLGWLINETHLGKIKHVWTYENGMVTYMMKPGVYIDYSPSGDSKCSKSAISCEKISTHLWLVRDFGRSKF